MLQNSHASFADTNTKTSYSEWPWQATWVRENKQNIQKIPHVFGIANNKLIVGDDDDDDDNTL